MTNLKRTLNHFTLLGALLATVACAEHERAPFALDDEHSAVARETSDLIDSPDGGARTALANALAAPDTEDETDEAADDSTDVSLTGTSIANALATDDEAATDETADDEAANDEALDEAASDDEALDEATSGDEAADDETSTEEVVGDDDATGDEVVGDEVTTDEVATQGNFQIQLTDAHEPPQFDHVFVTISGVDISTGGSWFSVLSEPRTIDLLTLQSDVASILGDAELEPGVYDQIRLLVSNARVVDGLVNLPVLRPTYLRTTGIEIEINMEITTGSSYALVLDFDAAASIQEDGLGLHLRPAIKVDSLVTN